MREEVIDTFIANCVYRRKKQDGCLVVTSAIADNYPLNIEMPPVIALFASAARDVLMPSNASTPIGTRLTIVNLSVTAAAVITLKDSADSALVPAQTVGINDSVDMIYLGGSGTTGWRKG
jgi:hypothetical protein